VAAFRAKRYSKVSEIRSENLREEAEGWDVLECGEATLTDDNETLEGFVTSDGKGMVIWDDNFSDWIAADDLNDLFREYLKGM
jgi:hypothetical protein